MKAGLRASFVCERLRVLVKPLREFVADAKGHRWQRMAFHKRKCAPQYGWVPVSASRADVEQMLDNVRFDAPMFYARPVFEVDGRIPHTRLLGAVDAPEVGHG